MFQRRGRGCSSHFQSVELHGDWLRPRGVFRRQRYARTSVRRSASGPERSNRIRPLEQFTKFECDWPWTQSCQGGNRRYGGRGRLVSGSGRHRYGNRIPQTRGPHRRATKENPDRRNESLHSSSRQSRSAPLGQLRCFAYQDYRSRSHAKNARGQASHRNQSRHRWRPCKRGPSRRGKYHYHRRVDVAARRRFDRWQASPRSSGECCRLDGPRVTRRDVRSFLRSFGGRSTPQPVPGFFVVPLRRWFEIAGPWREVLTNNVFVKRHAKPWAIRHVNKPTLNNWGTDAFLHERRPPRHIERVMLHRQKILGRRGTVHVRHATNRSSRKVHCHRHAKFLRHVADLVRLENSARRCKVRMDLANGVVFAQHAKRFLQINILARENWRGALL